MKHLVKAGLLSTALLVGFNAFAGPVSAVDCKTSGNGCSQTKDGKGGADVIVGIEDDGTPATIIKHEAVKGKIGTPTPD